MAGINRTTGKATDLITFSRASGGTYLDSDGLLKTASTNIPRIEYAADGTVKGLLIEEARTNLLTYSEDFTNASWITGGLNSVVSSDTSISPDGNTNADTLSVDSVGGTAGTVGVAKAITVSTSTAYTASVFAKADQSNFLALGVVALTTPANGDVWFDLANGTVGTSASGLSGSIQSLGSGWYRCSMTFTTDAADTSGQLRIYLGNADGGSTITRDGTSSVYLYGAQFEAGSFPTSYIPTSGATATRAADIASISVDSFGYRQDAGTVVVDVNTFDTDYSNWVWVLDGTSGTSLYGYSAANGWRVFGSGGTVAYLGSLPANADAKIGYAYSNAGSAALIDGGSVGTEPHSQPVAVTTIRLGAASASSAFLNGHIKSIQYLPRRLSDAQLQALTA